MAGMYHGFTHSEMYDTAPGTGPTQAGGNLNFDGTMKGDVSLVGGAKWVNGIQPSEGDPVQQRLQYGFDSWTAPGTGPGASFFAGGPGADSAYFKPIFDFEAKASAIIRRAPSAASRRELVDADLTPRPGLMPGQRPGQGPGGGPLYRGFTGAPSPFGAAQGEAGGGGSWGGRETGGIAPGGEWMGFTIDNSGTPFWGPIADPRGNEGNVIVVPPGTGGAGNGVDPSGAPLPPVEQGPAQREGAQAPVDQNNNAAFQEMNAAFDNPDAAADADLKTGFSASPAVQQDDMDIMNDWNFNDALAESIALEGEGEGIDTGGEIEANTGEVEGHAGEGSGEASGGGNWGESVGEAGGGGNWGGGGSSGGGSSGGGSSGGGG